MTEEADRCVELILCYLSLEVVGNEGAERGRGLGGADFLKACQVFRGYGRGGVALTWRRRCSVEETLPTAGLRVT